MTKTAEQVVAEALVGTILTGSRELAPEQRKDVVAITVTALREAGMLRDALDVDTGDDFTEWEKTYSYGCMKVEHDGFECLMNYGANVVAAEQCARSCGGKLMRRTAKFGEWEEIPNE